MAVTKSLRYQVLRRDNFACRYCGQMAPDVKLVVDHVVPVAHGGSDDPSNLTTACEACNAGKAATPADAEMVADVAQDALRWRRAMVAATEMASRERDAVTAYCDAFLERWKEWTYTDYRTKEKLPIDLPGGWERRVGELMTAGLTVDDVHECIDVAMSTRNVKDEFSYFVGVARQRLAQRQAVAAEMIRRGLV